MTLEELPYEVDRLKTAKPCQTCGTCPTCGAHARPYWWQGIVPPYNSPGWYPQPTITLSGASTITGTDQVPGITVTS